MLLPLCRQSLAIYMIKCHFSFNARQHNQRKSRCLPVMINMSKLKHFLFLSFSFWYVTVRTNSRRQRNLVKMLEKGPDWWFTDELTHLNIRSHWDTISETEKILISNLWYIPRWSVLDLDLVMGLNGYDVTQVLGIWAEH